LYAQEGSPEKSRTSKLLKREEEFNLDKNREGEASSEEALYAWRRSKIFDVEHSLQEQEMSGGLRRGPPKMH